MAWPKEDWQRRLVHGFQYTIGYIHNFASICNHEQDSCRCTNFQTIVSDHSCFASKKPKLICKFCTRGSSEITSYCKECQLFLCNFCENYHAKIRPLLKHAIIKFNENEQGQFTLCKLCTNEEKATTFCRLCGFIGKYCVEVHEKIRIYSDHSVLVHNGKNIADLRLSEYSPTKSCDIHTTELCAFCPERGELICNMCEDVRSFRNLTCVTSYYALVDIINDYHIFLCDLVESIPSKSKLANIVSSLIVWIRLGQCDIILADELNEILSFGIKTYHPELAVPYTEVSCMRLKCILQSLRQDLVKLRSQCVDIHPLILTNPDTDSQGEITQFESRVLYDAHLDGIRAISETQDSVDSLELFGEGVRDKEETAGNIQYFQATADQEINNLRKHASFSSAENHESYHNIHSS